MLALSIRQPYVEMILRGMKTVEHRSKSTNLLDTRFYLYAPLQAAEPPTLLATGALGRVNSRSGRKARGRGQRIKWLDELWGDGLATLPRGLILGSAIIIDCTQATVGYQWHLAEVRRLKRPRKPTNQPQPVWFEPF